MSFYEPQGWQAPARQVSWEQPPPPSRSGASSTSQREDTGAFATQFAEVDRAIDNLVKGGKLYPGGPRRESMPSSYGSGQEARFGHGPRFHGGRHSFYAAQRFQGRGGSGGAGGNTGQQTDVDPMQQAKRRMAAQRERELRNYHQEQQYNRSVLAEMASNKSERSLSPSTLSEEGRRELIARQHRALYGGEGSPYAQQGTFGEGDQGSNPPGSATGGASAVSPRAVDPFAASAQGDVAQSGSPSTQQAGGKMPTPPGGDDSGHSRQISKSTTAPLAGGMAPIGSRPTVSAAPAQGLNKRTTSPLPSSLGYGFNGTEHEAERAGSAQSNNQQQSQSRAQSQQQQQEQQQQQQAQKDGSSVGGAWGTGSGVWGSNKIGATSVWG